MDVSDFMNAFLEELDEQLTQMERQILELEKNGDDDETIQNLFRAAHTLKGSSAAMGFEEMKQLTHEMEQVMDEVRSHRLCVSPGMIQLLIRCFDGLKTLQEGLISAEQQAPVNITPLLEGLRQFVAGANLSTENELVKNDNAPVREDEFVKFDVETRQKAIEGLQKGLHVYDIDARFNAITVMRGARAYVVTNSLKGVGEIITISPRLDEIEDMEDGALLSFRMVYQTILDEPTIYNLVFTSDFESVAVRSIDTLFDDVPGSAEKADVSMALSSTKRKKSHSVRVDVEQLETLMNLVGELVIDQARIARVQQTFSLRYKGDEQVRTLSDISTHLSHIVSQLQENVMMARMLPIESLFDRFPRIVRDLSQTLAKDVELVFEGRETRLDRTVIEEIADPLIHLIRNAVDHGIESPAKRVVLNKPAKGTLHLSAAHEDNRVAITVKDDGAGISADKMKESAIDKGLITPAEAERMSDFEAVNLIFRPGFSTAKTVSDISGRGVGMDIVRNHIEKLNGTIEIQAELGKGTTFRIKLPLTLAIIPALLVGVGDQTLVVPMNSVLEIVRIRPETIQSVKGNPVVFLRERVMPIVHLRDYFHLPVDAAPPAYLQVVIVGVAQKRVALVVDELHGNQEIVKKSLGERVGVTPGVAGVTILGDGRVGLILDITQICDSVVSL